MIIADLTIWSAVLRGNAPHLSALFADLHHQGQLTAPALAFGYLVRDAEDNRAAERIRGWALSAPTLAEPPHAWLAAGDLAALFEEKLGQKVPMLDCYLVALALREDHPIWTFNPLYTHLARCVPLTRYTPSGV